MSHPYSALCGCNACEIEGHAQDNIADSGWTAEDEREAREFWEGEAQANAEVETHERSFPAPDDVAEILF